MSNEKDNQEQRMEMYSLTDQDLNNNDVWIFWWLMAWLSNHLCCMSGILVVIMTEYTYVRCVELRSTMHDRVKQVHVCMIKRQVPATVQQVMIMAQNQSLEVTARLVYYNLPSMFNILNWQVSLILQLVAWQYIIENAHYRTCLLAENLYCLCFD